MISHISRLFLVFSMVLMLSVPRFALAASDVVVVEKPSELAMIGDVLIARPALLVITVVGTALFVVSLPFSLAGGNALEAGNTLVVQPAMTTFVRCLGCTNPGYKQSVAKAEEE